MNDSKGTEHAIDAACTGGMEQIRRNIACQSLVEAARLAATYINSVRESTHKLVLNQIVTGRQQEEHSAYDMILLMSESQPVIRAYRTVVMRLPSSSRYSVTYLERLKAPVGKSRTEEYSSASNIIGGRPIPTFTPQSIVGFEIPDIKDADDLEHYVQDPQNLPIVGVIAGLLFFVFCLLRRCTKPTSKSKVVPKAYRQVRLGDDSDEDDEDDEDEDAINPFSL